ncbi:MAG: YdgA family protein [Candidatus Competibacteraceae bacterium]|nr:YdgA family protein [Candidatus Competibacteraceae bacterium]
MLSKTSGSTLRLLDLRLTMDQQYGRFGFMIGDSALRLESLETTNLFGDVPGTLKLTDLVLRTDVKERESWMDSGFSLAVKELTWNQATIGSVQFQLSANRLNGATLAQLKQWNRQYSGNDDNPAAVQALLNMLPTLLRDNPELVWEVRANAPEGDLQASAKIVLQDPGSSQSQNPVQWFNAVANANAELAISRALLEASLTNIVKAQLIAAAIQEGEDPDEQELTDIAVLKTQQQLAQLQATQWLRLEEETYRAQARFEQGRLFVNDTEIPFLF